MRTIADAAQALATGRTTSRALVEECLARIADPNGEGARTFVKVWGETSRALADQTDALRRAGWAPSPYAGIPVSLKDLVDVAGEPTPAGSRALATAPPAQAHAPVLKRLLTAGFVPIGRTNMSEFAYSGLGLNPHFGTPRSPWDRDAGRVPGGSSAGAAVSVADGMAYAGLGTDTGGSCRIPAAYCGVVGYKPTASRVPIDGILPLAPSLDSVGPLARSVTCCAIVDAVFAGDPPVPPSPADLAGLRIAVPETLALDGLDPEVAAAFDRALALLSARGARISRIAAPEFTEIQAVNTVAGFAPAEAFAWHRQLLAEKGEHYDPRIRARIERGQRISAADYIALRESRARLIRGFNTRTASFDVLAMPTCPILPPRIADLEDESAFNRVNLASLRNTALGNFLDRCAISLPCHAPGGAPVGFMLMGETRGDSRLFAIALAVEAALAG